MKKVFLITKANAIFPGFSKSKKTVIQTAPNALKAICYGGNAITFKYTADDEWVLEYIPSSRHRKEINHEPILEEEQGNDHQGD